MINFFFFFEDLIYTITLSNKEYTYQSNIRRKKKKIPQKSCLKFEKKKKKKTEILEHSGRVRRLFREPDQKRRGIGGTIFQVGLLLWIIIIDPQIDVVYLNRRRRRFGLSLMVIEIISHVSSPKDLNRSNRFGSGVGCCQRRTRVEEVSWEEVVLKTRHEWKRKTLKNIWN